MKPSPLSSPDALLAFGDWVKTRRRALDWTQAELAERVGCARVTIRKIESGEMRPSKQLAQTLAKQLGIPPAEQDAFIRFARSGQGEPPTASPAPAWNLPVRMSPLPVVLDDLFGREGEIQSLRQLFAGGARLVTLTGPGGVGKTSLAIQAAASLGTFYQDGVAWVDLSPLRNARLVTSTLAHALGLQERGGQLLDAMIKEFLRDRRLLLVMDNFEHLISASGMVSELLTACPQIAAMITSREPLRVRGEKEFGVRLLDRASALELFVARAHNVKPDFQLTDETNRVVTEICARLDGLPLAIELVASRMRALTPQELLTHLDEHLPASNRRDAPLRQRTIDDTIRWSYDLLEIGEQKLFRQLAVFAGGWTLDAADAVGGASVLEPLARLIEKSLAVADSRGGKTRYRFLGTIREFAQRLLQESGEGEQVRDRHAEFFLRLAEEAEPHLTRAEQLIWFDRLEDERDNLRTALDWVEMDKPEFALRLAAALGTYWDVRSYFREGREHLSAALTMPGSEPRTMVRAKALYTAGCLALDQGDFAVATELVRESQSIYAELAPRSVQIADTVRLLGYTATETGQYGQAATLIEQAFNMMHDLGDAGGMQRASRAMGWFKLRTGDYTAAADFFQDALERVSTIGGQYERLISLAGLAEVKLRQGDLARASQLEEEVLQASQELGDRWRTAACAGNLAWIALRHNDVPQAIQQLQESLQMRHELGDRAGCAWCLERFAEMAVLEAQHTAQPARVEKLRRAARLSGAAAALRAVVGSIMDLVDQPDYDARLSFLRTELATAAPERDFQAAWAEGQAMSLEQAIEYALAVRPGS